MPRFGRSNPFPPPRVPLRPWIEECACRTSAVACDTSAAVARARVVARPQFACAPSRGPLSGARSIPASKRHAVAHCNRLAGRRMASRYAAGCCTILPSSFSEDVRIRGTSVGSQEVHAPGMDRALDPGGIRPERGRANGPRNVRERTRQPAPIAEITCVPTPVLARCRYLARRLGQHAREVDTHTLPRRALHRLTGWAMLPTLRACCREQAPGPHREGAARARETRVWTIRRAASTTRTSTRPNGSWIAA